MSFPGIPYNPFLTDNDPVQPPATAPSMPSGNPYRGLSLGQRLGLVLAGATDGANQARGIGSNELNQTLGLIDQTNARRAFASTPFTNPRDYFQTLVASGVPFDAAIQAASALRNMQNARTLPADEAAARGYRRGTVVQEGPGGEDRIVQQSDVKSPEAVAQEFEIARGMPVTQAQQDKFDILRGRFGLPPSLPFTPAQMSALPGGQAQPVGQNQRAFSVPVVTSPEDAMKLPRGSYFRTPGGQLKQVP